MSKYSCNNSLLHLRRLTTMKLRTYNSAEVVVDMIISEIDGLKWTIPDWLPERYLTWNRDLNKDSGKEGLQGGAATG